MFELEKRFHFEAGHLLTHHDGKCASPHGHSYELSITLRSTQLIASGPKQGMLLDFHDITNAVHPMIETYFDHKWLNETLNTESPTVEFIAQWIYQHLKPQIPPLHAVSVSETSSSKASYSE